MIFIATDEFAQEYPASGVRSQTRNKGLQLLGVDPTGTRGYGMFVGPLDRTDQVQRVSPFICPHSKGFEFTSKAPQVAVLRVAHAKQVQPAANARRSALKQIHPTSVASFPACGRTATGSRHNLMQART